MRLSYNTCACVSRSIKESHLGSRQPSLEASLYNTLNIADLSCKEDAHKKYIYYQKAWIRHRIFNTSVRKPWRLTKTADLLGLGVGFKQ